MNGLWYALVAMMFAVYVVLDGFDFGVGALHLYVADVDAAFKRAVSAGARASMPVADMFWGDRYGKVTDPFGHEWGLGTHKEDVSPADMEKRAKAFFAQMPKQG